jgi:hypothetical protein
VGRLGWDGPPQPCDNRLTRPTGPATKLNPSRAYIPRATRPALRMIRLERNRLMASDALTWPPVPRTPGGDRVTDGVAV